MKISACITLHEREVSVLDTVFGSMKDQDHDEFVIVLDRTHPDLAGYCEDYWAGDKRVKFVKIVGDPGWKSPVAAWNAGFGAVTGDHVYCFSSETVQSPGNVELARVWLALGPTVVQGKAECSCGPNGKEVEWMGTAPGNLLCDAAHARPLGFIWAGPMDVVRRIGGYDMAFDAGLWHDDTDFFLRVWRTGLDFIFDDRISGTHLHHERPVLSTPEGIAKTQRNLRLILAKHGTANPWGSLPKLVRAEPGLTVWSHV